MLRLFVFALAVGCKPGETDVADTDPGPDALPCDVREVAERACLPCHGDPVTSNASISLVARSDFQRPSSVPGESVGARSAARLVDPARPMPPVVEPPLDAASIAVLTRWVEEGLPPGECGVIAPGPYPTTCASGLSWTDGDRADEDMNPGLACRACHQLQAPDLAWFFMGTVFPAFHEADLCLAQPPEGALVEILDSSGNVTMTLIPNGVGNFFSNSVASPVPVPYRARLVANGRSREMMTAQTDGDCNGCHTEQGANEAPGRLVWP